MRKTLVFVLLTPLIILSCEAKLENPLIGSWYSVDDHLVMQFSPDGSVTFDAIDHDLETAQYSVVAEGHLRTEVDGVVEVVTFSIEGNWLFIDFDGNPDDDLLDVKLVRLSSDAGHPER